MAWSGGQLDARALSDSAPASSLRKGRRAETIAHKISQETLAEMIGTTRSRVNFFMNKFQEARFHRIYGGLKITPSLMTIIVHD